MIIVSSAFQAELDDAQGRIIRTKIETYDTKMCTDTTGIPFVMYEWTGSGTPDWAGESNLTQILPASDAYGVIPNLSLNWAYSSPFFLNAPYYAVEFDGYIYNPSATSDKGFYVFGDNQTVELIFDGTTHITSGATVSHSPLSFAKSSAGDTVTGDSWDAFTFRVWGETGGRRSGITLMYTDDLSAVDEDNFSASDLEIVNCGMCNVTNSFLSPTTVTHYNNIRGDRKKNEPTEYSFDVPLGDETGAYIRNSINEYVNGAIELHEGRLIKIWAGYDCDTTPTASETEGDVVGNVEYIPRFTGFIHGFEANRNNDTLTVKCRDFFSRAEEVFCVNYPDPSSYWGAGYFLYNQPGEPDGVGAPVAYDRWNVVYAILDLFLKAGIPASLFYDVERLRATNGNVYNTSTPSVYNADYNLSSATYYGTSEVEEYINRFDVGTTVFEAIMKIVDTYGYDIEFKPNGYLRFFPKNNPTGASVDEAIIDSRSHDASDDGQEAPGVSAAQGGHYVYADTTAHEITFGVDGSGIAGDGFALIVVRDTLGGASDNSNQYWSGTSSVDVDISIHGGASVYSDSFNFYMSETWYYGQGVYPALGANPCYIPLTRSLNYDFYDITVTVDGSYTIKVDELWAYSGNVSSTAVKTLQTYKASGIIASLSSVDYERSMDDLRNDILVVGQRKGIWVADGATEVGIEDPEFSAENNNQFVNYHSRAVDVESIYNPSAANYTGRHLMTYIQEPSINTYARADWLSFSMLNAYRDYKNKVKFSLIGDPEVYINDPITVKDKVEEDGLNTVWVEGFSETITKTDWDMRVDVVGNAPFPSYTEDSDHDVTEYNDRYFSDLDVVDNFGNNRDGSQLGTANGNQSLWSSSSFTLNINESTSGWNTSGTMVVMSTSETRYGVLTYTGLGANSLTGCNWVFSPDNGWVNDNPVIGSGWRVENTYNPYEESDYGGFVHLQFRTLVTGTISVGVKTTDYGIYNFISGVSSGGGINDRGLPKDQKVYPGEVVDLIWGGVDNPGITHDVTGSEVIGEGYFAEDGQYYFTIDYWRESDGTQININSNNFIDENGSSQSKPMYLRKSKEDAHLLTYTFEDNPRGSSQYSPGNNGGVVSTSQTINVFGTPLTKSNTNFIWVSTDGNINVTLRSFYIDATRTYYINYSSELIEVSQATGQIGGLENVEQGINRQRVIDYQPFQGGGQLNWNYSDGYTFTFNPDWNDYGAYYVDGHWNTFHDRWQNYLYAHFGKVYFIRLILDIRDGSGRRIHYRNESGEEARLPATQAEITSWGRYSYSERNWDTVLELVQIPTGVDENTAGFLLLNNMSRLNPYFEASWGGMLLCSPPDFAGQYGQA
jgi:hypothetical protein